MFCKYSFVLKINMYRLMYLSFFKFLVNNTILKKLKNVLLLCNFYLNNLPNYFFIYYTLLFNNLIIFGMYYKVIPLNNCSLCLLCSSYSKTLSLRIILSK